MSPGVLIAIDVAILYAVMGPLVLFALYVVFDSMGRKRNGQVDAAAEKKKIDPALRVDEEILL